MTKSGAIYAPEPGDLLARHQSTRGRGLIICFSDTFIVVELWCWAQASSPTN